MEFILNRKQLSSPDPTLLKSVLLFCFILIGVYTRGQRITPYEGPFPVPPANKNSLFYLQRTMNSNTVVYEMNYETNGTINRKEPVKVYWINYADGGNTGPLTFMQNKFAYGLESTVLDQTEAPAFRINLVSYKKIDMYLKPTGSEHRYQIHVTLSGREFILEKVLIDIVGGTYLKPIVYDIELVGKDIKTREAVTEKIKP